MVEDQIYNDLRKILSTKEGLRYFKHLMWEGYLLRTTYTGNANSYFLEGRRNLALMVFDEITEALKSEPLKLVEIFIHKEKEDVGKGSRKPPASR